MSKGLFNLGLRMEGIDFQLNDSFGPDLEALIQTFEPKAKKGFLGLEIQKLPQVREIEDLIFKRLRMKVVINTQENMAAIIPFHLSQNAVLLNKFMRQNDYLKEQAERREVDGIKGTVDENAVKLSGVFSEYPHSLFMEFGLLFQMGLNAKQITSILLHELGHGFYACAYSSRMDRCNQVLSEALRKGNNKDKAKFIEVTYKELKGSYPEIRRESVEKLTSMNPAIICTGAYQILAEAVFQQQESSKYDDTSFEALADNFASRFGYGEYLVSGLEKLYPGGLKAKWYFDATNAALLTFTIVAQFFMGLAELKFWVTLEALGVGKLLKFFGLFQAATKFIWATLFVFYLFNTSGEAGRNYTYDDLEKRYNRIRNQIIEAIKNRELPKQRAMELIDSAEMIGALIKDVKPYRGPLDYMFNTFNPKDVRAKNSIQRQQAIENLLSNDVFLMSMKLKVNS